MLDTWLPAKQTTPERERERKRENEEINGGKFKKEMRETVTN